jgi:hypothetical protein
MTNPVFPTLKLLRGGHDASKYGVKRENPAMATEMEGGYIVSRARHTRKPRKTFTTGYTEITDEDRKTIETFYEQVGGGSVIFDWTDPIDKVVYQVRFNSELTLQYVGIGKTKLWNIEFEIVQA